MARLSPAPHDAQYPQCARAFFLREMDMGKGLILWMLGVPGLLVVALLVFGIL